jgi:hypothetical protein
MRKNVIRLTESQLYNVINESVKKILREFDETLLDGIDSIDARSINMYIKEMIPLGNKVSVKSPYKPIRQLVLYFSPEGASKHGGRLTKDIVNNILKNVEVKKAVDNLTKCDKNIIEYIYGSKKLTGKPLMQRIVWELDGIIEALMKLNEEYKKTNSTNWFGHTEAIRGSEDGRRVGLGDIMFKAVMGATKIKSLISKMQNLLDKPTDPFSYRINRTRR